MCGCNKSLPSEPNTTPLEPLQETPIEGCSYTKEQADVWLTKVNCVKDNGLYVGIPNISKYQLNLYIGILSSFINYKGQSCYFREEMMEIESFIILITSMNLCTA